MAGSHEKMEVAGIEPTSFQPWATLQTTSHPFQAPYWEFPVDEGKQENKDEERNQASIWALYLKIGSCHCSTYYYGVEFLSDLPTNANKIKNMN